MEVTKNLLAELGSKDTPIINVLNKCDKLPDISYAPNVPNSVFISAKKGTGIHELLQAIDDNLPVRIKKVKLLIPFSQAGLSSEIRTNATLISEEYTEKGILIEATVDELMYNKLEEYLVV